MNTAYRLYEEHILGYSHSKPDMKIPRKQKTMVERRSKYFPLLMGALGVAVGFYIGTRDISDLERIVNYVSSKVTVARYESHYTSNNYQVDNNQANYKRVDAIDAQVPLVAVGRRANNSTKN